ncbi:MAG: hypothetical protein ABI432_11320 [Flavobacteriales bacterium]
MIDLYQPDGSHPTVEGTYLAACVFYSTLFHASCAGASFNSGLQADTAAILRTIASAVVLDSAPTWNLDVPSGTSAQLTGTSSDGPNEITLYHPGQGTHLWTCSDGQSSTDANPTFIVSGPGFYTFTHIYHDPCGNSDTLSWTFEFYEVGMPEIGTAGSSSVTSSEQNTVDVIGGTGGGSITIMDLQGRTVVTQQFSTDHVRITCPPGLHVWRITPAAGQERVGKVLVR